MASALVLRTFPFIVELLIVPLEALNADVNVTTLDCNAVGLGNVIHITFPIGHLLPQKLALLLGLNEFGADLVELLVKVAVEPLTKCVESSTDTALRLGKNEHCAEYT